MKNKCDILNFEWASRGRDIDIIEPVLNYLELKHNYNVVRESIWFGELKLLKYRPKMFLISNSIGAGNNVRMVKLAHFLGIKTVALSSEGDFVEAEDLAKLMFWGWNKERKSYEDLTLCWSERVKILIDKYVKPNGFRIEVSGATGFDRYQFWPFMEKHHLLEKYGKENFKKVIGIAVYSFDYFKEGLDNDCGDEFLSYDYCKDEFFIRSRDALNQIYRRLIIENPETLFILKVHPATFNDDLTDCRGLFEYPNVLKIHKEENIGDIVNSCDLWLAFESTSCFEAWLLRKTTFYINPLGGLFNRSIIASGAPQISTYDDLAKEIAEYFETGISKSFEALRAKREKLIPQIIGYDDGRNHIRAAEYIHELYTEDKKKPIYFSTFIWKTLFWGIVKYLFAKTPLKYTNYKKYKGFQELRDRYNYYERKQISEKYRKLVQSFDHLQE